MYVARKLANDILYRYFNDTPVIANHFHNNHHYPGTTTYGSYKRVAKYYCDENFGKSVISSFVITIIKIEEVI